jgi:hypothetical protein
MSGKNSSGTHTFFSFLIAVLVTLNCLPCIGLALLRKFRRVCLSWHSGINPVR